MNLEGKNFSRINENELCMLILVILIEYFFSILEKHQKQVYRELDLYVVSCEHHICLRKNS